MKFAIEKFVSIRDIRSNHACCCYCYNESTGALKAWWRSRGIVCSCYLNSWPSVCRWSLSLTTASRSRRCSSATFVRRGSEQTRRSPPTTTSTRWPLTASCVTEASKVGQVMSIFDCVDLLCRREIHCETRVRLLQSQHLRRLIKLYDYPSVRSCSAADRYGADTPLCCYYYYSLLSLSLYLNTIVIIISDCYRDHYIWLLSWSLYLIVIVIVISDYYRYIWLLVLSCRLLL